jgi:hypothetical protein
MPSTELESYKSIALKLQDAMLNMLAGNAVESYKIGSIEINKLSLEQVTNMYEKYRMLAEREESNGGFIKSQVVYPM